MKTLLSTVRAGMRHYNMISENDKIGVCVSGGKDSVYLLYALNEIAKYSPINFSIIAIVLDPCFNNVPTNYANLTKFCNDNSIKICIKETELAKIIFEYRQEKNPCSLCSRMRAGILHSTAIELGCNKVALGHHYDDAIETLLLNLFHNGNLSCFSPNSFLSRKSIHLIRPLIFCTESQIVAEVRRLNLPISKSLCPADGNTERQKIKELIQTLEKTFPDLKKKLFNAVQGIFAQKLENSNK